MKFKKIATIALAGVMAVGIAGAFTGCGKNSGPNTFTFWVGAPDGVREYGDYENNPAIKYLSSRDWTYKKMNDDGTLSEDEETAKISFRFEAPSGGSTPQEVFPLALSNPCDIMESSYSTDSIIQLYNNGKAMDITPYVEAYMPHYKQFLIDNDFYNVATNVVNGQRRYLQLWSYWEKQPASWFGYQYRRDWISEYGKDPKTNTAFGKGHYTDVNDCSSWTDTVKFPSWYSMQFTDNKTCAEGDAEFKSFIESYKTQHTDWQGDYPVTISDWEWMLDIFKTALSAKGISDGYCMSLYQPGFINSGNLVSSFGGGGVEWYKTSQGDIQFGATGSTFKTYVEAMNKWYSNGWIDTAFQTHSDMFYETDAATVRQGKVGLWCGYDSQLFNRMDISRGDTNHLTNNCCSLGAPYPYNDKYGSAENKYKDPDCFYEISREIAPVIITPAAKDKNLPLLFTMLDYMYTREGGVIKQGGLTEDIMKDYSDSYYTKNGFSNGLVTYEDGTYYLRNEVLELTGNEQNTFKANLIPGLCTDIKRKIVEPGEKYMDGLWVMFKNKGFLTRSFTGQLSIQDGNKMITVQTDVRNECMTEVPKFIKGTRSMSEWNSFTKQLTRLGVADVTAALNALLTSG